MSTTTKASSRRTAAQRRVARPAKPPDTDAWGYLPYDVSRLVNALNVRLGRVLRPLELTIQQFRVMQVLRRAGMASIGEISRSTIIEQSVVSRIADQLEDRGLASRRRNPTNGRIVEVSLTTTGKNVLDSLTPQATAIVDTTVEILTAEERRHLSTLLRRLFERTMMLDQGRQNP